VKRREFVTLLGGAAAWPLAACAHQGLVSRRGFPDTLAPSRMGSVRGSAKAGRRNT
jgi:hypothetical protein